MRGTICFRLLSVSAVLMWAASMMPALAVQTKVVTKDSYAHLAPGQLRGVSLSHRGWLTLAPEIKPVYRPDTEIVWAMAVAPDGRVFYGSGHEGKIFFTDRKGSGTLFLDTDSPEVTALLFHDGKLYAGTSPDGKLWVCDPPGTATLVYETEEKYIWDMLVDPKGRIVVATGTKGKIFKVDPDKKKGELLFDAPDENVLSLVYGPKGRLHAATQGKGRVYRWDEDRATTPVVLFEARVNEVRRIAIDPEGNVFAAVNSEMVTRRLVSPLTSLLSRSSGSSPKSSGSSSAPKSIKPSVPSGKSEIYLIDNEGFVRSLWNVSEAPVHDMVYNAASKSVLIAAGGKGKLFRLDARGNYWIVLSVEQEQIFALEPADKRIHLATVGPVATYTLGEDLAREGKYLSPALNAGRTVRWGTLRREGENGIERIKIDTRCGNTKVPDGTWYDWQEVKWENGPTDGRVQSPVARYLQWRARFKAPRRGESPALDLVEVFYAPANEAPRIKAIQIKKASVRPSTPSKPPSRPPAGKPSGSSGDGKDLKITEHSNHKRFEISWLVADPNRDSLESALYFKGEDEKAWKKIKDKLTTPKHLFETATLADGVYRIKAVVTDRPGNFAPDALGDELISDRFVVDNTPPEIAKVKTSALRGEKKGRWRVSLRASDSTSLIAGAKYNINGQKWQILVPADGLFDEQTETIEFDTEVLEGSEHVLGLVITDREGNSVVDKAMLQP